MVSLLYSAFQNSHMQEAKKFALDVSLTFIASIINMLLTFVISIILEGISAQMIWDYID